MGYFLFQILLQTLMSQSHHIFTNSQTLALQLLQKVYPTQSLTGIELGSYGAHF